MTYKIAYIKDFDFEGYCYRQRITVTMTAKEFIAINDHLRNEFKRGKFFAEPLDIEKNYTTSTTEKIFVKYFGIDNDKRYIDWTNTVINIKLI